MTRQTILYLDDEAQCLDVFRQMFGGDYDVRTAGTPAEARAMLAARPADVVISDQFMPEMSGTEFLREVAAAHPESYRVLLTGGTTFGGVLGEIVAGVVSIFVTKPWTEPEMRETLERAFAGASVPQRRVTAR